MQARAVAAVRARRDAKALADAQPLPSPVPTDNPTDDYTVQRLARTRKQIEMLDEQLEEAPDARAVKAIADALARLVEIERVLAGRPLPGSRRPGRERPAGPTDQLKPI